MLRKNLKKFVKYHGVIRKDTLLISLGGVVQPLNRRVVVDPYDNGSIKRSYLESIDKWDSFLVNPGEFILVSSKEHVKLSINCYGLLSTLSHTARLGLMSQPTSFFIDPGFTGHITLEICNLSKNKIRLYNGMPIAKLIFLECGDRKKETKKRHPFYYGKNNELRSKFSDEFRRE